MEANNLGLVTLPCVDASQRSPVDGQGQQTGPVRYQLTSNYALDLATT